MKIIKGNLEIKQGDTTDYSDLEEITGDLFIYSSADLKAPNLKSVGGDLSIYSFADLKAPNLKSVGGYLSINSSADLKAPNLKSVGGDLSIYSSADLKAPNLKSVGGYLFIYSSADLKAPNLKSVGGDLFINSKISIDLAKNLWGANRKKNTKWKVCNLVPDWLIKRVATKKDSVFKINNVELPFEWFEKIRKDKLSPGEVFAIDNVEHRRIAYEMMDKAKMKQLKDFTVLETGVDEKGKKVEIVSFTVQNMKEPLIFYHCFCPSTGREYFLQTDQKTWKLAKARQFGFNEIINFINEW